MVRSTGRRLINTVKAATASNSKSAAKPKTKAPSKAPKTKKIVKKGKHYIY